MDLCEFQASLVSEGVSGQPVLHRETLFQKKNTLSQENGSGRERREDRLELAMNVGRMLA